ncbi:hypothetical protein BDQ17DRAFT_1347148 [Cyathus striatus]|nr:hypothetical protein BDQ17DRAFT_1347148 [Cyathus striatus]
MATVPQQLLNMPNTRYLKSLTILYDLINRESMQPLLDEIDSSICKLEKLSIFYNGPGSLDVIPIIDAFITKTKNTLTTLEFKSPKTFTDDYFLDISNLKHLRTIKLSADVLSQDPLNDIRTLGCTTDGPLFSRLQKVLFRINGAYYDPSYGISIEDFKGYLPKTNGSGSVRVEVEYNEIPDYENREYEDENEYVHRSYVNPPKVTVGVKPSHRP